MKLLRNRKAQNTAEYLIMLVLVAVGSIGMFSLFGGTLKNQLSNAVAAIAGDPSKVKDSKDAVSAAENLRKKGSGMDVTGEDVERYKPE